MEAVRAVTGVAPAGFRAPYWSLGEATLGLVEAAGFAYDSSLMAERLRPVPGPPGRSALARRRHDWGEPGSLVEVPVYWAMDDWPHFEPGPGRSGLAAPSAVLEIWTEELRYAHEHAPGGLVMVTVHPECIGRGHGWRCSNASSTRRRRSTASPSSGSTPSWTRWSAANV